MKELFRNARLGWAGYMGSGKLAALLLASLLFLWFGRNRRKEREILLYTTAMTLCCILPFTAVLLMFYQTRFYDYEWIWSLVPMTAMTAYGLTAFLAEYQTDFNRSKWRRGAPVLFLLAGAILLSGSLGSLTGEWKKQREEKTKAYGVLNALMEECPAGDLCLWAPQEIMEYAREVDGTVMLPYGRNMWDFSLNAYTYDTYDKSTIEMYQWMKWVGETGRPDMKVQLSQGASGDPGIQSPVPAERTVRLEDSVGYALDLGVNCILISENAGLEVVKQMERVLGVKAQLLECYYIFWL